MDPTADDASRPRRVGIFGGTFDPPHRGHVSAAGDVADALTLDEVWWVPAGQTPDKDPGDLSPAPVRLAMTRAAAAADERFRVSDIEVERPGPSYTVDTLRRLRSGPLAGADLFLIMGADRYGTLSTWREPDAVRALSTLAVMDRDGESVSDVDGVVPVPIRRVDVSSTAVRAAVAAGEDLGDAVPAEVARIIRGHRLYGSRG